MRTFETVRSCIRGTVCARPARRTLAGVARRDSRAPFLWWRQCGTLLRPCVPDRSSAKRCSPGRFSTVTAPLPRLPALQPTRRRWPSDARRRRRLALGLELHGFVGTLAVSKDRDDLTRTQLPWNRPFTTHQARGSCLSTGQSVPVSPLCRRNGEPPATAAPVPASVLASSCRL